MKLELTEPGVYDLPADVYHRDPVKGGSLSSTGARKLLPPSAPALFKYDRDHGQKHRNVFDLGHAFHTEVLGAGEQMVIIDADDYKKADTRAIRDAAYADGRTPLLTHEHEQVLEMAASVRRHPIAGPLFARDGDVEQTLVWQDPQSGVMCRAMLDKMIPGQRLIIVDLKSTGSAEPEAISKSVARYGYIQQDAFYREGAKAVGLDPDPRFVFVFVEKTPPHLISIVELDPEAVLWGQRLNRKAIDVYRTCKATNRWPGYQDGVLSVSLPAWSTKQLEDAWFAGDLNPTSQEQSA